MSAWWILVSPFGASLLAALLPTRGRNREFVLAEAAATACALLLASHYPAISRGEVVSERIAWLPGLGIDSGTVDPLSL